jgi:hypothetical protein
VQVPSLVSEVRGFLDGLRAEWPELFRPSRPAPAPAAPRKPAPEGGFEALFHARAAHFAPQLGVTFGKVRVKDQKTLWGSCAPSGDLNFNWRLTLAPPEVLDYVVIHELAHRLEMNHSPRFWKHVAALCPEHRERRRWLRKNGQALFQAEAA